MTINYSEMLVKLTRGIFWYDFNEVLYVGNFGGNIFGFAPENPR